MSKRFTDTEKWNKPWYRKLPPKYKLLWEYIYTKCNQVGVWDVDMELASIFIGDTVTLDESKEFLGKQIRELNGGSKWLVEDFVSFQYGELTPTNNFHRSLIAAVGRIDATPKCGADMGLTSPIRKDKDKDKEKKGKEEEGLGETKLYQLPDPVKDPAKCLVITYKTLLGIHFDDRVWDEKQFGRSMAAATDLLHFCRDLSTSEKCLRDISTELESSGRTWTLETIVKLAPTWLKKNGRTDANASRAGLRMAIAQRKTETNHREGMVKPPSGTVSTPLRNGADFKNGTETESRGSPEGRHVANVD